MFIIVLGQHVSILIESSSGSSKIQILNYQCLNALWDPTAHFKHCFVFLIE